MNLEVISIERIAGAMGVKETKSGPKKYSYRSTPTFEFDFLKIVKPIGYIRKALSFIVLPPRRTISRRNKQPETKHSVTQN